MDIKLLNKLMRVQNSLTLLRESLNLFEKGYYEISCLPGEAKCVVSAIEGIRETIRMGEAKFDKLAKQLGENAEGKK